MRIHGFVTGVLVVLVLAGSASADVTLKNGEWLKGKVVSSDAASIEFLVEGSESPRRIARDELTATSWYQSRSETIGEDAKGRLELATWCIDNKLYANAQDELIRARDLDPALAEPAEAEWTRCFEEGAKEALTLAENNLKTGNYKGARRFASLILLKAPETSSAARAQEILDQLDADEQATPQVEKSMRLTREQIEADPRYKKMTQLIEAGRKANRSGLKATSLSAGTRDFERATKAFKEAIAVIDEFLAKEDPAQLPDNGERARAFRAELVDETIETYINWGGLLAVRSSYNNAMELANQAILMDQKSERAQEFRAHVQSLAAESSRWARWRK
jgi:hypothetical protein